MDSWDALGRGICLGKSMAELAVQLLLVLVCYIGVPNLTLDKTTPVILALVLAVDALPHCLGYIQRQMRSMERLDALAAITGMGMVLLMAIWAGRSIQASQQQPHPLVVPCATAVVGLLSKWTLQPQPEAGDAWSHHRTLPMVLNDVAIWGIIMECEMGELNKIKQIVVLLVFHIICAKWPHAATKTTVLGVAVAFHCCFQPNETLEDSLLSGRAIDEPLPLEPNNELPVAERTWTQSNVLALMAVVGGVILGPAFGAVLTLLLPKAFRSVRDHWVGGRENAEDGRNDLDLDVERGLSGTDVHRRFAEELAHNQSVSSFYTAHELREMPIESADRDAGLERPRSPPRARLPLPRH